MNDIATYLDMGGHAAFIWPALGVAAFILVTMTIVSWRGLRASEADLRAAEAQAPHRRGRQTAKSDAATDSSGAQT